MTSKILRWPHSSRPTEGSTATSGSVRSRRTRTRATRFARPISRSTSPARYGFQGQRSISGVWIRRAERLIGTEGSTYVHGFLAIVRSEAAAASGDIDAALVLAESAIEIGQQASHPDLSADALVNLGGLKIATGSTIDGVAMMEEAAIAAVDGELSPFTTGVTACRMISACRDLTDYRRATEWIEATERYCDRQSLSGFPGVCRIHRAEVAAVGGAWDRAEEELERATTELEAYKATPPQADGFYAIGDIRRLRGDFVGAEAALREAHQRGRSPQPALALLRLAEGKVKAASTAIEAAVADESRDHWARTRLLPAQVEIAIAAGDVTTAREAVEAFTANVAEYPSPALVGSRQTALGRVLLAEGDATGAARELRAAIKTWRDVGAPYEVARTRAVLSRALRVLGDEDDAEFERSAALDEFRRLGAQVDVGVLEREERDATDRRAGPTTARMTFMFTDIVGSTNLAEAIGDGAWERVLRWHDDTLRTVIAGGEGTSSTRPATGSSRRSDRRARASTRPSRSSERWSRVATRSSWSRPSGSGSTPPRRPCAGRTTAARASMSRPGSGRSRAAGRSSRRPRCLPRPAHRHERPSDRADPGRRRAGRDRRDHLVLRAPPARTERASAPRARRRP